MARSNLTLLERLTAQIVPVTESGCWIWMGALNKAGYAQIQATKERRVRSAHRVSYELFRGPIPLGLDLDHLCRVRCCVNPAHLEPVTKKENTRRGENHNRLLTACPKGHPYDKKNTYRYANGDRDCRECGRILAEEIRRSKGVPVRSAETCRKGHPYDEGNTYMCGNGRRYCRTCSNMRAEKTRRIKGIPVRALHH